METKIIKIEDINPAKYNPRIQLKPGDVEYEALKNSLEKFGTVSPLLINKTTGNLVSGHQRLNILKQLGETETEVILIEIDEEKEKLLNITLNKIEGEWDYEKLEELFSEFSEDDIKFTGYTEEELDNLFDKEVETGELLNGDSDDESDSTDDTSDSEEPEEDAGGKQGEKEFKIFLSFPSKELAENWLESKGQENKFDGTSHNITIRMEGADFENSGNTD